MDYIPGNTSAIQYEFSKKMAQIADSLHYDSVYAYDHFIPYFKGNLEANFFECYVLLSAILPVTKRLRIGQTVTCNPYRNPALLAKMISTMDVISNGRMELGIGAGWYEKEFRSYGYDFPPNIERIRQLDEALYIIRSMWTKRKTTFNGKYYSIEGAVCKPKPIQVPHPKIMVGGSGEKHLLKVVAKHADRYNHAFVSPEDLQKKNSILKEHCAHIGREHKDIERSVLLRCLIRETEDEIRRDIKKWKAKNETIEQFETRIDSQAIIGAPHQVISKLNQYVAADVTHFVMHFIGLNESTLKLFDSKVIKKM